MIAGALKSKTMRLALLLVALGQVQIFLPMVQQYMTPLLYGLLLSAVGVAVGVLRVLTTVPLSEK